jgi:lycopene cyclase domain-containing protein
VNTHYTYLLILALSLAGPLALSFDKKVAFYSKWKQLFAAMILPVAAYIAWDMYFTHLKVWGFNTKYIQEIWIGNLPLEEVLFFIVVPYCCVFIYECIRCYWPNMKDAKPSKVILFGLAIFLAIMAIVFHDRAYTFFTATGTALVIGVVLGFRKFFTGFHITAFLIAYAIALIPFLIVNGLLTALPVVEYNNAENLAIRIYTIPVEDVFYGMLLILLIVLGYERKLKRS